MTFLYSSPLPLLFILIFIFLYWSTASSSQALFNKREEEEPGIFTSLGNDSVLDILSGSVVVLFPFFRCLCSQMTLTLRLCCVRAALGFFLLVTRLLTASCFPPALILFFIISSFFPQDFDCRADDIRVSLILFFLLLFIYIIYNNSDNKLYSCTVSYIKVQKYSPKRT